MLRQDSSVLRPSAHCARTEANDSPVLPSAAPAFASSTATLCPRWARWCAQLAPMMPAPTTTTSYTVGLVMTFPVVDRTLLLEVGVAVVRHPQVVFRRAPRAGETNQVPHRAGLVVGARRARTADRLLADDGAGGLVVDVEVAGRVPQGGVG